jgi:hypothetical protein
MSDSVLCRVFHCKNPKCEMLMLLQLDKLLQLSMHPAAPSTCAPAVVLLCHRCKQIKTYSVQEDSSEQFGEDHWVSQDRTEAMDRLTWLRCEEETCGIRLPLVETWNQASTAEFQAGQREANAKRLNDGWTDLFCPEGHRIPFPQTR